VADTFTVESAGPGAEYAFACGKSKVVKFNKQSGFITEIQTKALEQGQVDLTTAINLEFVTYGVGKGKDRNSPSGAYLMMPDGAARSYQPDSSPSIRITRGPLLTEVDVVGTHSLRWW
jgi:hypothetical protein